MDKRDLANGFRERLRDLVASPDRSTAEFLRETGMDRSALSQFLDPRGSRLPRAEMLRRIASTSGVSIDWLLLMENAREGGSQMPSASMLERAQPDEGPTPLERWHREATGFKIRYVPSILPDIMGLKAVDRNAGPSPLPATVADRDAPDPVLEGISLADSDLEIAMPLQRLETLADCSGIWKDHSGREAARQLHHMADMCQRLYPSMRLHLYDDTRSFTAPFTVFGRQRAAVYIGGVYLVVTLDDQVRTFVSRFDTLVRQAVVGPDTVHDTLRTLAARAGKRSPSTESAQQDKR